MLSGATKYQIADAAAHRALFEHALFQFLMKDSIMGGQKIPGSGCEERLKRALFQFFIKDSIMGVRRYRAQAAKKG